jgi:hypothetical protein
MMVMKYFVFVVCFNGVRVYLIERSQCTVAVASCDCIGRHRECDVTQDSQSDVFRVSDACVFCTLWPRRIIAHRLTLDTTHELFFSFAGAKSTGFVTIQTGSRRIIVIIFSFNIWKDLS